ncbi:hypothetical protein LCGC14_0434600 [marine sediment metagenome]|uniref:Resolvase HTH domain-containing protein n=1 Tax=marine sediment metagenome TaxID=412755 RepID=A0A0F9VW93_9ZZZZ
MKCPICKGKGIIDKPNGINANVALKHEAVAILYKEGYGIRQIQRLLNYKSPRSVQVILMQAE